ncbi:MAG: beta-ketoacyl-[acyl-carrier-protein] synthase family protein, partial [Planctomycetes bacterium]|nr:beta-ketoacyl-[acyl-carrier-protein] synthase family protein [Planctomycetota bacterium]
LGKWGTDGLESLTPLWLLKYLPNMLACHVGIIHDIRGPSNSLTCGEASGHLAIAEAAEVIARGSAEAVITGGSDAKVNPIMILRQCLIGRAAVDRNGDPEGACRPFDADASGSVFGEGSGILVLEEAEFAKKRGATILAEIVGVGESNNLNAKYESLEAGAVGTQIAIEMALEDAGIEAKELDLVFPHGTGIADDDAAEAEAIANVLGDAVDSVAVWPTKGMLSNTGAAGGALDVVAAIMAMKTGKIGPAKNCNNKADGCKLNIVNEPLDKEVRYALCCSYTFGGQTAAVVLKRYGS